MRLFLAIMIFAVSFSGFAAAAHAFEESVGNITVSGCHDMPPDSPGDQPHGDVKSKCHDCCLTNAVFASVSAFPVVQITGNTKPLGPDHLTDSWLFSLLRPPRTFA